jgi:site-specific DNA recombinase
VCEIFSLAAGREGRPFAVKGIACRLTERGITRRGVRFSTCSVYEILTSSTYYGQHYFNRRDSRTGAPRPPSHWVGVSGSCDHRRIDIQRGSGTPTEPQPETDAAARRERPDLPRRNRPVWLLRRRHDPEHRQGLYRYYCCSSKLKKGPSACRGVGTPMEKLDEIVVGEVARQVLDPDRLAAMLDAYVQSATVQAVGAKAQLAKLRHDHTAAVAGIARLLELVEKGLMEAEDPSMREGLISRSPSTTDVACNGIKGGGADTGPSRAASNRVPSAQLRHTQPDWQSPLESRLRPNLLGRHLRHHHPRHFRI